jgi:hypothetical protein
MREKPERRSIIHSNAHRDRTPAAQTRLVSKTEYALRKTLAISLSVCLGVCGTGGVLLLLGLPYSYYLDARDVAEHGSDLVSWFMAAASLCMIFIPILSAIAVPLWWGSRKSWKTIRALQPIDPANTAALPAVETLVRASHLPPSHQQTELLRAAGSGQKTPVEELLRASVKSVSGQDV